MDRFKLRAWEKIREVFSFEEFSKLMKFKDKKTTLLEGSEVVSNIYEGEKCQE